MKFISYFFLFLFSLQAKLVVEVTQGNVDPLPIALPIFSGETEKEIELGEFMTQVIASDLQKSGLFKLIDPNSFVQTTVSLQLRPRFSDWRVIKAQHLAVGKVYLEKDLVRVQFRLWDVVTEKQVLGLSYTVNSYEDWRRLAHKVSDAIYKELSGEDGYFDTRIVHVTETGRLTNRKKQLAIMDQDGANYKYLTSGKYLVVTPRFSPTAQDIVFLSYYKDVPRVYYHNLDSGKTEKLGEFIGMTFAPRFSPDGKEVILAQSINGISSIYTIELETKKVKRLTKGRYLDVSPCYSPDKKQIVFNSDRGGTPQLYVMNSDGSEAKRISFGRGRYATPVWSPRGDWIAFTRWFDKVFYIGVIRPDGTGERLITKGYLVEGPTWSPNGRQVIFTRQNKKGKSRLCSVDITGKNEKALPTPHDASDPAWSPLLP